MFTFDVEKAFCFNVAWYVFAALQKVPFHVRHGTRVFSEPLHFNLIKAVVGGENLAAARKSAQRRMNECIHIRDALFRIHACPASRAAESISRRREWESSLLKMRAPTARGGPKKLFCNNSHLAAGGFHAVSVLRLIYARTREHRRAVPQK